jgi:hypothetical protein
MRELTVATGQRVDLLRFRCCSHSSVRLRSEGAHAERTKIWLCPGRDRRSARDRYQAEHSYFECVRADSPRDVYLKNQNHKLSGIK